MSSNNISSRDQQWAALRLQQAVARRKELEDRLIAVSTPGHWALSHGARLESPELVKAGDELLDAFDAEETARSELLALRETRQRVPAS